MMKCLCYALTAGLIKVIKKFGVESDSQKIMERVAELLDIVKLPRDFIIRKPRQLSGGQKQRVGIARAFAGNPAMVIADEPISALDVSVAAAVTELLMDIQREHKTTLLFISHDLSAVRYLADRVVVMYVGRVVEVGTPKELFSSPKHPYTAALISALPKPDPKQKRQRTVLEGEVANPAAPPAGCYFHPRCPHAIELCKTEAPGMEEISPGRFVSCHRASELDLAGVSIPASTD